MADGDCVFQDGSRVSFLLLDASLAITDGVWVPVSSMNCKAFHLTGIEAGGEVEVRGHNGVPLPLFVQGVQSAVTVGPPPPSDHGIMIGGLPLSSTVPLVTDHNAVAYVKARRTIVGGGATPATLVANFSRGIRD